MSFDGLNLNTISHTVGAAGVGAQAAIVFNGWVGVTSAVLTLLILVVSEIIPKTIAAYKSEMVAYTVSHILLPLRSLLFPVIWLVSHITHMVLRMTGVEKNDGSEHIGMEELRTIVGDAGHLIPKHHRGMLLNILDLELITVDDIMIPRNEVYGIDIEADTTAIIEKLRDAEFTRIPVYQNDIDNVVGILHQRDIINSVDEHGKVQRDRLLRALRAPYFIPEGTPLHTQLFNFQKQTMHSVAEILAAAGIGSGDIVQNCFSYHLTPAGMMFENGARAVGAAVLPAGVGQTELQAQAAHDIGCTAYVGTPDYLKLILDKAEEMGLKLKFSKAAVGGGAHDMASDGGRACEDDVVEGSR